MATITTTGWTSGRVEPKRLRLYHIAFVLFTTLIAIAIALPSVLSQPQLYRAEAVIRFDSQALPGLLVDGAPTPTLRNREAETGEILRSRYAGLGGRLRGRFPVAYTADTATVAVFAPSAEEADRLANDAATGLARRMFVAQGDALLREVLSQYVWASLNDAATVTAATPLLRNLVQTAALSDIRPRREARALAALQPAERFALTRSLEVQDELKGLDIIRADALLGTTSDPQRQAEAREARRGANDAQNAVRALLLQMYANPSMKYDPLAPNSAWIAAPAVDATALPTYTGLKIGIIALVGLLGGLFTVAIDRRIGIVAALVGLWGYREMIRNLVGRDLKARYKSSLLGYLWSLLNPLMTMVIFWVVFSVLLRNNIPQFPVFLIVGLLPWQYAVASVSGGMRAVLDNANLVKKVYFPRAILPITTVISNLVNYLLALPVMFVVMWGVQWVATGRIVVSWTFAYLPLIILIQTIFLIGVSLLLSTVAVFFRDTTHIVDIFLQLWIFITPVFFSLDIVTGGNLLAAKAVRWINPMASLVDFYRDILYGRGIPGELVPRPPSLPALDGVFRTLLTALVLLAIGAYVFARNSHRFGEEL